jgi:hypothetical protein
VIGRVFELQTWFSIAALMQHMPRIFKQVHMGEGLESFPDARRRSWLIVARW